MYAIEQPRIVHAKNKAKRAVFGVGTRLGYAGSVKRGFPYKAFSIIAGILVAIVVVITLWFNQLPAEQSLINPIDHALSVKEHGAVFISKVLARIPW